VMHGIAAVQGGGRGYFTPRPIFSFRNISKHPLSRRMGGPQCWPGHFREEVRVAVEGDLNTIPQTLSTFLDITPIACGGSSYKST
jgi:hypothetical protein